MDSASGAIRRALVVEDDCQIRALLVAALEEDGWRVLASDHPPDPTEIRQLRPGVVLLDLRFAAGDDGWGVLEQLRTAPDTRDIPVVVCTADARRVRERAERLAELAAPVVLKPFDLDDLLATVARAASAGERTYNA